MKKPPPGKEMKSALVVGERAFFVRQQEEEEPTLIKIPTQRTETPETSSRERRTVLDPKLLDRGNFEGEGE